MVRSFYILSIIFTLITLAGCNDYEFPESPYPRIETLPVDNITDSGVTFNAQITFRGDFGIVCYGFVWDKLQNPDLKNSDRVFSTTNLNSDHFSADINTTLEEGFVYHVRSFIITEDYIVYGKDIEFSSLGSLAPVVSSLYPVSGVPGDTVTITGKNFSYKNESNIIRFNDVKATVLGSSDTVIQAVVPDLVVFPAYLVTVEIAGNRSTSPSSFSLLAPIVYSVSSLSGTFRDTVIITGNNFPKKKSFIKLSMGGINCPILASTGQQLAFQIPVELAKSDNQILLMASGSVLIAGIFKINPPEVTHLSGTNISAFRSPPIVIKGSGFSPVIKANIVKIGGFTCEVLSSSGSELIISVPVELVPDIEVSVTDKYSIEITVLDQSIIVEDAISVSYSSRWTRMKDFPGEPRIFGASFAVNGKGYIGLGGYNEYDGATFFRDFWEYDPAVDSWRRISDFPGTARNKFVTLVIGTKVYIITGSTGNPNINENNLSEVWEFDPASDIWTRKADFPGGARFSAFGFVAGNKGYLGCGVYGNYVRKYDFWRYDPETDGWVQLGDIPKTPSWFWNEDIFPISDGQNGYILTYQDSRKRYFWKYNAVSDNWTEMVSMPGPFEEVAGFFLKGKFYVGTGIFSNWSGTTSFYEYHVNSNSWLLSSFKGGNLRTASSFSIGDFGYILLGISDSDDANKRAVWKFDPTKP